MSELCSSTTVEIYAELLRRIEHRQELREGLIDTPSRVLRMWSEIFSGYGQYPAEYLENAQFSNDHYNEADVYQSQMVIVKDIEFYSHCEHHMVPFFGKVHIGYIPKEKVVGISKFARVVDAYAKRLQIQERLTNQIADCIWETLQPLGVIVVAEAQHLCMKMRGVRNPTAETVTSAIRGVYQEANARAEFMSLIRRGA